MTQTIVQYGNSDVACISASPNVKIVEVPNSNCIKLKLGSEIIDIQLLMLLPLNNYGVSIKQDTSQVDDSWEKPADKTELPIELPKTYKPNQEKPSLTSLTFKKIPKECWRVNIQDRDYQICCETAKHLWSSSKKGNYGRGLANTSEDPYKVERTGLLGEMAFAKMLGLEVDTSYCENGVAYDFILNGKFVDVKTETKRHKYECGLIYARSESGKTIPLKSDIYVFSYLESENSKENKATIVLLGYCTKLEVERILPQPGRRQGSTHMNYEVQYHKLHPLKELMSVNNKVQNIDIADHILNHNIISTEKQNEIEI